MTACLICAQPMPPTTTRGKPRTVCSTRCAATVGGSNRWQGRRDQCVEEVEHLTSLGVSAREIARQLGIKPESMERAMHRAGRHDLAKIFRRTA